MSRWWTDAPPEEIDADSVEKGICCKVRHMLIQEATEAAHFCFGNQGGGAGKRTAPSSARCSPTRDAVQRFEATHIRRAFRKICVEGIKWADLPFGFACVRRRLGVRGARGVSRFRASSYVDDFWY